MHQESAALTNPRYQEADEYLSFWLNGQLYCVDILRVLEIRGWEAVTRVPRTADFVRGVLNLRGEIVPVIDLRMRFGIEALAYTATTVVVIVSVQTSGAAQSRGMVVDSVSEVIPISSGAFRAPPEGGRSADAILGLTEYREQRVMLLDLDRLLGCDASIGLPASGSPQFGCHASPTAMPRPEEYAIKRKSE